MSPLHQNKKKLPYLYSNSSIDTPLDLEKETKIEQ